MFCRRYINLTTKKETIKDGVVETFNENGQLRNRKNYKDGEKIDYISYDEKGFELNEHFLRQGSVFEKIMNIILNVC